METYSSSFCVSESCLKSIPKISVPIAGVKWVTLLAARKRSALLGSADNPRSTTSTSSSGSQDNFGNEGWGKDFRGKDTRWIRKLEPYLEVGIFIGFIPIVDAGRWIEWIINFLHNDGFYWGSDVISFGSCNGGHDVFENEGLCLWVLITWRYWRERTY